MADVTLGTFLNTMSELTRCTFVRISDTHHLIITNAIELAVRVDVDRRGVVGGGGAVVD